MAERDEAVYALMSPLLFASTKGVTPSLLLEILLSKKTCAVIQILPQSLVHRPKPASLTH